MSKPALSRQFLPTRDQLPLHEWRVGVLEYIPSMSPVYVAAARSVSSAWRDAVETRTGPDGAQSAYPPMLVCADGRHVMVVPSGSRKDDEACAAAQRHPHRDIDITPAKYSAFSEAQLFRALHIVDSIARARPHVELRIHVDYRGWHPRGTLVAPGTNPPVGFTDTDTLASITPQQLTTLRLGPQTPLPMSALESMLTGCYQIATLEIDTWCDDTALMTVSRCVPNLGELILHRALNLSDESLRHCAQLMRSMHSIRLIECPQITDSGVCGLLRGCSETLRHLAVPFCERLTDLTLAQLSTACGRSLVTLDVSGNRLMSPSGLLYLFTQENKIEELSANFIPLGGIVDSSVLEAMLEFGWTLRKLSCAFCDTAMNLLPTERARFDELVRKIRFRGCDFLF